jgi:hypothetical protein
MATNSHIPFRAAALCTLVCLAAALFSIAVARPASAASAYGWPVKPFDRAHPVRGSFGDPRTVFLGPPTESTLLAGSGVFQFHFGIDVSAPNGTAVYPVASGTVRKLTADCVVVASDHGRSFEYWHIVPSVHLGQKVDEDVTVLGHILRPAGHVHLSELDHGVYVNPLQRGHLGPYADHTKPIVESVAFRHSVTGRDLMPELLRGRVEMIASAYDMPSLPVQGEWHDLPVTPALLTWRIQRVTGKVVVPEHTVYDVRRTLPSNSDFWKIYARGTHQNMCVFGAHYSYMQPGAFLFRLAPGGFDTRTLRDDVYELVVTATDIRGNHSSTVQRFSIHNRPGVTGP